MITEYMMHRFGWADICYFGPRTFFQSLKWGERWHIGVWTGPQNDLLCLKPCKTNEECEIWLSPGGTTIKLAMIGAISKYLYLKKVK